MSDKIPSRLDSLNRAAKPGLKFKPKTVARRSKEDRDAHAPVSAPDDSGKPRGPASRGRGGARGGMRGGKRGLQGTHVVQAGPLASGNVLSDTKQNLSRSTTMSPSPGYLSNLVKKESQGMNREGSVGLDDSDDEEDLTRINMNDDYKFSAVETELFPVRAPRERAQLETVKVSSRETTPSVGESEMDVDVKSEDGTLSDVLKQKESALKEQMDQLQMDEQVEDNLRMVQDHKDLIDVIHQIDNSKQEFLMFQLPRVLPSFEEGGVANPEKTAVKAEDGEPQVTEGQVASLRVHKSGKLSVKIGNVVMDVSKGSNAAFLQQLVGMKTDEPVEEGVDQRGSYLLGHMREKIVVTPKFV